MFTPKQIGAIRRALGLSAVAFAAKLGVRRETIYSWENGDSHPRYRVLEKLNKLADTIKQKQLA